MPRYIYQCQNCNVVIDSWHGMSEDERLTDCEFCLCRNSLVRKPTTILIEKQTKDDSTGDLVKRAIDDFSDDLREEKERLKKTFYEDWD